MSSAISLLGSTFNTTSGTHTVTATPAVNDLIVIIRANTGNVVSTAPTDNNGSGTYTLVSSALKLSSSDLMEVWVRNSLIGAASSTTFTDAAGTTTGGGLAVLKVTGMTLTGAAAARQNAVQSNKTTAIPAPVFTSAPLTTNPVIGAVFNGTSPATMTPRTSFTELVDVGYTTPAAGFEVMSRDSGETATTQTWGSTSASSYCAIVVELAYDSPPTVALNTPSNGGTVSTTTPVLSFTGTDADSEDITYETQVDPANTFDSQTPSSINVAVYAYGGGGGGGTNNGSSGSGGGGGGEFASEPSFSVSSGTGYSVVVGIVGQVGTRPGAGSSGGNSTFNSTTVVAHGGGGGVSGSGTNTSGVGGTGSSNTTHYDGGAGGLGGSGGVNGGGGGGGASGSKSGVAGNGSNWSGANAGAGGTPASADGGTGGGGTGPVAATTPGGGGSGDSVGAGGIAGAKGAVIVRALLNQLTATGGTHTSDATYDYWTFASSGTWTPTIVTFPLIDALSAANAGFTDVTNGADTDPFASGDSINYVVQSALTNGVTYYWRVRGKDPTGSKTFGPWSGTSSFTVTGGTSTSGQFFPLF